MLMSAKLFQFCVHAFQLSDQGLDFAPALGAQIAALSGQLSVFLLARNLRIEAGQLADERMHDIGNLCAPALFRVGNSIGFDVRHKFSES
jgi:hypothetical protein